MGVAEPGLSFTGDGPGGGGEDEVVDVPAPGGAATALSFHGALPPLSKNAIPLSLCGGGGEVDWKILGQDAEIPS